VHLVGFTIEIIRHSLQTVLIFVIGHNNSLILPFYGTHPHVVSQRSIAHDHGSSNPTTSVPTLPKKKTQTHGLHKTTQTDLLPSNISTLFSGHPLLFLLRPLNLHVLYSFLSKLYPLIHFIFLSHLSSSYARTPQDP